MERKCKVISIIGSMLLLCARAGAQDTGRPDQKSASGSRNVAALVDPKTANDPKAAATAAAFLENAYQGASAPESVRMLIAILRGSNMGPGEGWFGPAASRYSWKWLAERSGLAASEGSISQDRFNGPEAWFSRLDRNKDGVITRTDLDWSERNPFMQMSSMANRLFHKMNPQGNGRLTRDELVQFFEKIAQGKDYITFDDFRDALLAGRSAGFQPGDAPSPAVLIRGLFAGEIGSMSEGPRLGETAPNFSLKTVDGKRTIPSATLIGSKPLVLVFGNFTCGPFRSLYPEVDAVYQRYKNDANFLMVYVREAHPTDGWKMESNSRAGVAVKQPTTFESRVGVAGQFCKLLKTCPACGRG
jgi:thiol-disulfide isomerase/thioredoxin